MAKVKGYLANSKGKIGNLTFYHNSANGETQVREIVEVKNPKTKLQRVQRVIAKTSIKNYQAMKEICDHSFEGKTMGAQCMNRFNALNMRSFRSRAAEIDQAGESLNEYYNFIPLKSEKYVPAAVVIAEGSLPQVPASIVSVDGHYRFGFDLGGTTYQDIVDTYDLRRGDQLTFCFVLKSTINDSYIFRYARVILDPRNADGSGAPMSSAFVVDGAINKPNIRNNGTLDFLQVDGSVMSFGRRGGEVAAAAIIVSRKGNNYWFRSNAKMVLSEACIGTDLVSLDAASEEESTEIALENTDAYLNNAGEGGSQAEAQPEQPTVTNPTYSNLATINGVQQNVAGGSVTVTAPLDSVIVTGTNLADADVTIRNGATTIQPTSKTASTITFSNLNVAAGTTVSVYKGASQWFTIAAQAAGGGDDAGE